MKTGFVFLTFIFLSISLYSQQNLKGVWQGILLKTGAKESESNIIYLDLKIDGDVISGRTRDEVYKTDFYAIQKIKGTASKSEVKFKQYVMDTKRTSSKITWCAIDVTATYTDSTGYLSGTYTSSTCRNNTGKIILYRCNAKFSGGDSLMLSQGWRDIFLDDLKKGRKAPEIRERERKNFKFQPIYFDYDKDEIKPEFKSYLNEMIRVVNGHSDLRIKITGHTDSDGSDPYNDDLSSRRAKAIRAYFTSNGLAGDRLVIDFKGEKMPVDNNDTPEGKQHNRRVDFEFI